MTGTILSSFVFTSACRPVGTGLMARTFSLALIRLELPTHVPTIEAERKD
jgi:hypothetical protein